MSEYRHDAITLTTDASGDVTDYSTRFTGKLVNIIYTKTDYASGVDFAITVEGSGLGVWTELNVDLSATKAPSQVVHDNTGTATALYDSIVLVNDRVKVVVSNGGATKVGKFEFIYEKG